MTPTNERTNEPTNQRTRLIIIGLTPGEVNETKLLPLIARRIFYRTVYI